MNWDALGAIAELIGGIATVVTLVYLATQIRQNTHSVRAASAATYREGNSAFSRLVAESETVAELYDRGLADAESLSPTERIRFVNLIGVLLTYLHEAEELEGTGALSESLALTRDGQIEFFASKPGFRSVYTEYRSSQPPSFGRRMDAAIKKAERTEAGPPAA